MVWLSFFAFKSNSGKFHHWKILHGLFFTSLFCNASNHTRITWISDCWRAYSVVFSTCCAQLSIIAAAVVDMFCPTWHVILSDFLKARQLLGRMINFTLPYLIIFKIYFPLFITSGSLELMDCRDLFHLLCGCLPALDMDSPQLKSAAKMAREKGRLPWL